MRDDMEPAETIKTKLTKVTCDGDGGLVGHPLVYLTMGTGGFIDCPYCSRRFVLETHEG